MSKLHRPRLKAITLSLFATIIFIAAHSVTRADEITFSGFTAGGFDPPNTLPHLFSDWASSVPAFQKHLVPGLRRAGRASSP